MKPKSLVKLHIDSRDNQVIDLPLDSRIEEVHEERGNLVLHVLMPMGITQREDYLVRVQEPSAQFAPETLTYAFSGVVTFKTGTSFHVGIYKKED